MSLPCAHCAKPLAPDSGTCPACRASVTALIFPALHAPKQTSTGSPLSDGDASCFYHVSKKAEVACDRCGRFLCGLCHVDWVGQNWCPGCIEANRDLTTRSVLYDSMALQLSIFPLLIWPVTLITGPMALYIAIRHWRSPGSLVRRTRIRFYLAAGIASLEIIAWIWLFAFAVARFV